MVVHAESMGWCAWWEDEQVLPWNDQCAQCHVVPCPETFWVAILPGGLGLRPQGAETRNNCCTNVLHAGTIVKQQLWKSCCCTNLLEAASQALLHTAAHCRLN
jgi:hypothetical protein